MNGYKLTGQDEEEQLLGSLTPGASAQTAPAAPPIPAPQIVNQGGKQFDFTPGPNASLVARTPAPTPEPLVPPVAPSRARSVPLPAEADIAPYLAQQKATISRFGPDERLALQESLNARRNSAGYKTAAGLKGLADAVMQGVARAGNPGWMQQFEAGEAKNAENQVQAFNDARALNKENVQAGMTLDQMDPNSELSKSKQASYAPLFAKLGYPPEALQTMSASNIDSSLSLMAQFGGAEIQAMIKQYELAIERARLQAVTTKTESDERQAEENQRLQAAKELSGQTDNARLLGISIPFTKGPTDASEVGTKYLQDKLVASDAPYGPTTSVGGVEYEWSPITKKYHKKAQ